MPVKRVLHVFGKLNRGGAETLVMNIFRSIDRGAYQFDFIVHSPEQGEYEKEITELGGIIFRFPRFNLANTLSYRHHWRSFLREHSEYDAVHIHVSNFAYVILAELSEAQTSLRIVHAHSDSDASVVKRLIVRSYRNHICRDASHLLAVSKSAASFAYGTSDDVYIIPNAIDIARFRFKEEDREIVRAELKLDDKIVVGHIGSFTKPKNHSFLIRVFDEFASQHKNAVLLLVGEGDLKEAITQQTRVYHNDVRFLGSRSDVHRLLQAIDVLCMPSLYEGLPLAAVEAQASGLPCLLSNTISSEAKIVEGITEFLPLSSSLKEWASVLHQMTLIAREDHSDILRAAGYDMTEQVKWYEKLYSGGVI